MTQIKIFKGSLEDKINEFLRANDGKIVVKDIKFVTHLRDRSGSSYDSFAMTAMIIYEITDPS